MTFCPVYANMPLSPRKARHFPPSSGEADAKEKIIKFYKSINWSNEYTKNRIGNASCPRLSGKVSAKLTKGVRVSKHVKRFLTKR